jgi:CTP-dependent riboflavin kinase
MRTGGQAMKLSGTVIDGQNNANIWLQKFADVYAAWLGQRIFPGSLNVDTGRPFDWHDESLLPFRRTFSLFPHGGERDLFIVPCSIVSPGTQSCWLWTTTTAAQHRDDPNVVELIAAVGLRPELGLATGSRVTIDYPQAWPAGAGVQQMDAW